MGGGTQGRPATPSRGIPHRPGRGGDPPSPGRVTDQALDELAPVPDRPRLYPVGSRYYRVPITFEVEILDPGAVVRGIAQEATS